MGLRVLITNNTLAIRRGSELYVRDLATALLERGHTPVAYSTRLGEVAEELRAATVPVVDDLGALGAPPDVIHGHHHLETMTALLRFPAVPAVYVCHGWLPWQEAPPRFPRIRRYVAVDEVCRDRLVLGHGIPEERVCLLLNFVDLDRFRPRPALPPHPARALVFSSQTAEGGWVNDVRVACARAGMTLDVVGHQNGNPTACPEEALTQYDLVFAKGRSALEALAVGAAVVLCDSAGVGGMVTAPDLDRLRRLNLGVRTLRQSVDAEVLAREIARYDPADAAEVSRRVRATASHRDTVAALETLYRETLAAPRPPDEREVEVQATAAYLGWLGVQIDLLLGEADTRWRALATERHHLYGELQTLRAAVTGLREGHDRLQGTLAATEREHRTEREVLATEGASLRAELGQARAELGRLEDAHRRLGAAYERMAADDAALRGTATVRLREWLLRSVALGTPLRLFARMAKGRLYD